MALTSSLDPSSSIQSGSLPRQDKTAQKITKYTVVSSLTGGILTAAYESTAGRARAIRALEAGSSTNLSSNATGAANGHPPSPLGATNLRVDPGKIYRHNTALLSASAALNSGLVAFVFFSLREHIISPALSNARSNNGQADTSDRLLTWSAMRTNHLRDSALTGALLGGVYNTWKKGPRGIFPGAFTASLACTALQLVVNELDVQRIRYVSRLEQPPSDSSSSTTLPPSSRSDLEEKLGLGERMLALVGITKVDDEEYLRRLKAKRDAHLVRIRELEAQIEEERGTSGSSPENGPEGGGRKSGES